MKQFIREIEKNVTLYRDDKSGIAWIEDGRTGLGISVHANIHSSGSIAGMKNLGYWGKKDRTVKSHGFIYNIDSFVFLRPTYILPAKQDLFIILIVLSVIKRMNWK